MKWPAIGALTAAWAALAAGAYWLGSRPEPQQITAQREAKLESELNALRREVQVLKQTRRTALADPSPEHAAEAETVPRPAPAPSETPPVLKDEEAAAAETNRQIASELDARYTQEPADGAWSAGTVRKIRDAAAGLRGARLLEANCATSLCRVVLGHAATEEQHELGSQLIALDPFRNGVFFDYDKTPGALKTTLYVLREGKTFDDVRQSSL